MASTSRIFQNEIAGTLLADGASAGLHESQSRLYENNLGRSASFWKHFYPKLQSAYMKQLDRVSLDLFLKAINKSVPSFIRVEADELTYPLHIMVRYELEKALVEGSLEVEALPKAWNEKMEAYLGIVPPTDKLGVLQDVHWVRWPIRIFSVLRAWNSLCCPDSKRTFKSPGCGRMS